jgi:hypothetical protein
MKWIKIGFVVIVFILCIVVAVMTKQAKLEQSGANLGLGLAQVLAGLGVLATLVLVVKNLMNNPKGAIRVGAGFLVMIILYFIGKGMDAGELYPEYEVTSSVSKNVGGLLFVTYALGVVSAIAFVAALVMSIIKK